MAPSRSGLQRSPGPPRPPRLGLQRSPGGLNVIAAAVETKTKSQSKNDESTSFPKRCLPHRTPEPRQGKAKEMEQTKSKNKNISSSNEDIMDDLKYANDLLWEDREYARAHSVLTRVVAKQRDRLGIFHKDVAWTYYLMGTAQFLCDRPLEALNYLCESRRVFGFDSALETTERESDAAWLMHKRQDSNGTSSTWSCGSDSTTSTHMLSKSPDPTFDTALSSREAITIVSERMLRVLQGLGYSPKEIESYQSTLKSALDCEQRAYKFKEQGDMVEAEMYYAEAKNLSSILKQLTAKRIGR